MFNKFKKVWSLLRSGEYSKLGNALKLRLNRLRPGGHDIRTELAQFEREVHRVLWQRFGVDNQFREDTIKVALVIRGATLMPKSSAFIRLIAPLTHPSISERISIKTYPENTARIDPGADICIVQRTAFDSRLQVKQLIKQLDQDNIALVLDTDDAFHLIDKNHSEHKQQSKWVKALECTLSRCDQLWVSTPRLAELYDTPERTTVISNTLDERLWHFDADQYRHYPPDSKTPLQIIYMGTASHGGDFNMVLPALDKLAEKHPGSFELTVIGVTDEANDRLWIKRLKQPKFVAMYPNFIDWFLKQGPFDIGLSPLENTEFNRAKSDIKCLDYLGAGVMPVVSDIDAYQTPELNDYIIKSADTTDAWFENLENITHDLHDFRSNKPDVIKQAQTYILQQRSSRQAARQMHGELRTLISRSDPGR